MNPNLTLKSFNQLLKYNHFYSFQNSLPFTQELIYI